MTTYQGGWWGAAAGSSNIDVFTGAPQGDNSSVAARALRDFRNTMTVTDVLDQDGKRVPNVKEVEIVINNLTGGLNRVWGTARQPSSYYPYSDLDRYATGQLLTKDPGVVSLPLFSDISFAAVTALNYYPLSSVNVFNLLVIGNGKTANTSLKRETSSSDSTLLDITYNPTNVINNLCTGVIGGLTQPERLFVHKDSAAIEVLSDVTTGGPTVYGTMHGLTVHSWGHLVSPINNNTPGATTLLIYGNNAIWSIGSESAVGGVPIAVLSGTPNGGYPIGIVKLPGAPLRAYWLFPNQYLAHSINNITDNGAINFGQIVSTNLEGTDAQNIRLPLSRILGAAQFGDSIIFWDGLSIWELTDRPRNMHIFEQRVDANSGQPNSDIEFQVMGIYVINGTLFAHVVENNVTLDNFVRHFLEEYIPATGAWHRSSIGLVGNSTGSPTQTRGAALTYLRGHLWTSMAAGAFPSSVTTSHVHLPYVSTGTTIPRQLIPPTGTIPYYAYSQTDGAGATSGQLFETTTASLVSSAMLIEGLEGFPCVLEEVRCMGYLGGSTATTAAAWKLYVADQTNTGFSIPTAPTVKFTGLDPLFKMVKRRGFDNNHNYFSRLQYKLEMTQAGNQANFSYTTPNGVPFSMKFLVFLDNKPRSPAEVRGPSDY